MPPDMPPPAASGAPPAPPGGAPGAPPQGGPSASPMMTPQKPAGNQASGKAKVMVAQHILTLAMMDFGPASKDFDACLAALSTLKKEFGKNEEQSQKLMPAELMQALQSQAGPGAPPKSAAPPGAPPGAAGGAPPTLQ